MAFGEGFSTPDPIENSETIQQQSITSKIEPIKFDQELIQMGDQIDLLNGASDTKESSNDLSQTTREQVMNPELLEALEMFQEIAESDGIDGFDVFSNFIQNAPDSVKKSFTDADIQMELYDGISETGKFPVNELELSQMIVLKSSEDSAEKRENKREELINNEGKVDFNTEKLEQANEKRELLLNLKGSLGGINLSDKNLEGLLTQVDKLGEVTPDNADTYTELANQITASLSNTREIEKTILPEAKKKGPEVFKQVSASLIALNPSFEARIQRWETPALSKGFGGVPPEQKIRVSAALGTRVDEIEQDATQSGNIFTLEQSDGTTIDYDVMTNERSLTVDGYTLGSQAEDTGDYQKPKLAYIRVEQEHLPKLKKVAAAGQAIDNAGISDENIGEIKEVLKQALGYSYYTELGIDSMEKAGDIQSRLSGEHEKHNTPLQEARDEYRTQLLSLRDGHFASLKRKDKKTKETLGFLQEIGVTEIPQSIFTQVIDQINGRDGLRSQLGFTEKIDLENGQLGTDRIAGSEDLDRPLDLQDKKAFAEIINKMLGEEAINVDIIGSGAPVGDRSKFETKLRESGLLDVGGVAIAMRNLESNDIEPTEK